MQTTTSRPTSGTNPIVKVISQFGEIEYMRRTVFTEHYEGLGWYIAGDDGQRNQPATPIEPDLTGHQQALVQQATPDIVGDNRWLKLPEISSHDDARALFGLADLGIAYRSGGEFLLTATGRDIHQRLTN